VPTIFKTQVIDIIFNGKKIELELWDTAGQEDFDRLRLFSYPKTDVLLICFSVVSRDSYANVFEKWSPEVKHFCENVPFILVGTKRDLRDNENEENARERERRREKPIKFEEGCAAAEQINAYGYSECSAMFNDGVRAVFEMALEASMAMEKKGRFRQRLNCSLL
jgi:Ras homolog gene family, member A